MPEASVTITPRTASPAANDVLTVTGDVVITLGDDTYSAPLSATGWVSATTQHYPPDAYKQGEQGPQLAEGATPRAMTADEVRDYCTQLLLDAFVAATPLAKVTTANLLEQAPAADEGPAAPPPAPEPTAPTAPAAAAPATETEQPMGQAAPPLEGNQPGPPSGM